MKHRMFHQVLAVLGGGLPLLRPFAQAGIVTPTPLSVTSGEGCVLVAGTGSLAALKILVPPRLEQRD